MWQVFSIHSQTVIIPVFAAKDWPPVAPTLSLLTMPCGNHTLFKCIAWKADSPGMGVLEVWLLKFTTRDMSDFPNLVISLFYFYLVTHLNHINVCQPMPQLGNGNTCQICTWYLQSKQCFGNWKKNGTKNNRGNWFSCPHPLLSYLMLNSLHIKVLKHAGPRSVSKSFKHDLQRTTCWTKEIFAGHWCRISTWYEDWLNIS